MQGTTHQVKAEQGSANRRWRQTQYDDFSNTSEPLRSHQLSILRHMVVNGFGAATPGRRRYRCKHGMYFMSPIKVSGSHVLIKVSLPLVRTSVWWGFGHFSWNCLVEHTMWGSTDTFPERVSRHLSKVSVPRVLSIVRSLLIRRRKDMYQVEGVRTHFPITNILRRFSHIKKDSESAVFPFRSDERRVTHIRRMRKATGVTILYKKNPTNDGVRGTDSKLWYA